MSSIYAFSSYKIFNHILSCKDNSWSVKWLKCLRLEACIAWFVVYSFIILFICLAVPTSWSITILCFQPTNRVSERMRLLSYFVPKIFVTDNLWWISDQRYFYIFHVRLSSTSFCTRKTMRKWAKVWRVIKTSFYYIIIKVSAIKNNDLFLYWKNCNFN